MKQINYLSDIFITTDPVDDDLFLTREDKDNPSIVFKEKYK